MPVGMLLKGVMTRGQLSSSRPRERIDDVVISHRKKVRDSDPEPRMQKLLWELREIDIRIDWLEIENRVIESAPDSPLAKYKESRIFLYPGEFYY